jgi:adenosine 3'-phospho 5'-phosphosulfate transporter B3
MNRPGFHFGWFLGLLEMLGTCFFSFLERTFKQPPSAVVKSGGGGIHSRANLIDYGIVVFCLMASSSLSNIALNYINFPTKVVFRSCKLLPTMLIATLLHGKSFGSAEWAAAAAVCVGLILVAAADFSTEGPAFSPLGIALVCLSVVADAIMPNVQQRLFARGESRTEVVFWTNLAVSAWMLVSLGASGDLQGALGLAHHDQTATVMMLVQSDSSSSLCRGCALADTFPFSLLFYG